MTTAPIKLASPWLGDPEEQAVQRVLRSGFLVQGPEVSAFEAALCAITGRAHAVAVSNGTSALELSLRGLGVGPGDEVLCPALSWPSPGHAVLGCGARPVLVDVDAREWNADPAALAAARGPRTRAAILIDQFGNPARVDAAEAALPGLPLLVDAACSLGSTRPGGRDCGAAGAVATMSFHPRKVLTTGEGGVCLTDDAELAEALRQLRNHGQASGGGFGRAAGNARMTELQAALGRAQLQRLPEILRRRRALAARYQDGLRGSGAVPQAAPPDTVPNHQTFGVTLPATLGPAGRDRVIAALRGQGIEVGILSYALHRLPQFAAAAAHATERGHRLDRAATIADLGMALPMHPLLTESELRRVLDALRAALIAEQAGPPEAHPEGADA